MTRISEEFAIVPIIEPADVEAGIAGDSIHMGKVHHVCWILMIGAATGDAVLTVKSGATAGTETTSEVFHYRTADADTLGVLADNYGAWVNASTLTLTAATYDHKILIVEMDAAEMTDGQPWATLSLSNAASAIIAGCVAIAVPRYQGHDVRTVIA